MFQKKFRCLIWDILFLLMPVFIYIHADFLLLLTNISNLQFILLKPAAIIVSLFLPLYKAIGTVIEARIAEIASGTITPWLIWFFVSYLVGIARRGRYWILQMIAMYAAERS